MKITIETTKGKHHYVCESWRDIAGIVHFLERLTEEDRFFNKKLNGPNILDTVKENEIDADRGQK